MFTRRRPLASGATGFCARLFSLDVAAVRHTEAAIVAFSRRPAAPPVASSSSTPPLRSASKAAVRAALLQLLARKDYVAVVRGVEAEYVLGGDDAVAAAAAAASPVFRPAVDCVDSLHAGIVACGALRKVTKARQLITRPLPLQPTAAYLLLAYVDADRLDLVEDLLLQWLLPVASRHHEESIDAVVAYLKSTRPATAATAPSSAAAAPTDATAAAPAAADTPSLFPATEDEDIPLPPPAVWAAVARGYAARGAWAPCLLVADVALSRLARRPSSSSWRAAAGRCVGVAVRAMGRQGEVAGALRLAARATSGEHGLAPRVADLAHVLDSSGEASWLPHVDDLLSVVLAQARREQRHHADVAAAHLRTADHGSETAAAPELVLTARGAAVRSTRGGGSSSSSSGGDKGAEEVDLGAARALASALVTALCRRGQVAAAERVALRLAEAGAAREALAPAAVATLIHGLCLHPDAASPGGGDTDTSMARAEALFAYLSALATATATDTRDAVQCAAARRARAAAYHHICDGHRRRRALPALTYFVEQYMRISNNVHDP